MKRLTFALSVLLLNPITNAAAQGCVPSIPASAPNERYLMYADGTVTDKQTGLMWKRCMEHKKWDGNICVAMAPSDPEFYGLSIDWHDHMERAAKSTYANYNDWRLPNIKELQSIVEQRCVDPAINLTAFPDPLPFEHLSSTPVAFDYNGSGSPGWYVWTTSFYTGDITFKGARGTSVGVRLVRSLQ